MKIMNELDRCVICTCDTSEVKLKKCFHVINHYLFFTKNKCHYLICGECKEECNKNYGDNYCPLCRNKQKINHPNNQTIVQQFDIFENELPINIYGDSGFVADMLQENPLISSFHNKITFDGMTKVGLICYFFFSLWFAYSVMLPSLFVLYSFLIFGIENKYIAHIFTIGAIATINYFLIQCMLTLFVAVLCSFKDLLFGHFLGCY